jgi:two-component system, chemotaxis family, sensor kinase Cph1
VLRLSDLTILQASENTFDHFGRAPEDLLGRSISTIVGSERETRLLDFLAKEPIDRNPLYVFTFPARAETGPLDISIHTIDDLAVLECEVTGRGEGNIDPDYYALLKRSVTRLQTAQTLDDFCQIVAEEVRALTCLDRVMVYRFHEDFHGEVVAESKREELSGWLGLHYPAEDIPKPAREIFKKIWIRPLPDARAPVMELVPLVNPDTGKPLNMTHCSLRGASIMYTEYLHNMGVAASLTMALHRDGELWGLIACHHYKPRHFPYQVRAACEFLTQVASLQLRGAEQRESLVYRLKLEGVHNQLIAKAAQDVSLVSMTEGTPNLLDGIDAGGAALYHAKRWWRMGRTPKEVHLDALKSWLQVRLELQTATQQIYATDLLVRDYADAAAFADVASGVLAVPLARRHESVIVWFRPETIQTVKWGGNPDEKPTITGPQGPRLTPRKSFELFVESVRQRALPWKTVEIAAALRLRLLIMELVVTRAEQLSQMNAELTRSNEELDAFAYIASHDLKEPLRGISKYAHQLLESAAALDGENRKRLEGLMRLTLRMDSLLDSLLHFSRVGRPALDLQTVDLNEIVEEALEIIAARRQETPTDIVIPRPLPTISGDRTRVREVFTNLISNALKYNDKPRRRVEIGFLASGKPGGEHPRKTYSLRQTVVLTISPYRTADRKYWLERGRGKNCGPTS